jgi:hypothetical protein
MRHLHRGRRLDRLDGLQVEIVAMATPGDDHLTSCAPHYVI